MSPHSDGVSLSELGKGGGDFPVPAALLELDHVSKRYATAGSVVHALEDLDLDVAAGSFLALVGRSGCGKSTLLNMAGAMDFPSSGRVVLDGVTTTELNDTALTALRREKVGFIFQSFQLLPTLSVVENVELPLLLAKSGAVRERSMAQLEAVGLIELASRLPHQLSGGQMQRVAIARALAHEPRILLADEPTGNLDTTTGNSVLELLQTICRERHTTVLMATHSAEAAAVASTVVRMRDGRIEEIAQN